MIINYRIRYKRLSVYRHRWIYWHKRIIVWMMSWLNCVRARHNKRRVLIIEWHRGNLRICSVCKFWRLICVKVFRERFNWGIVWTILNNNWFSCNSNCKALLVKKRSCRWGLLKVIRWYRLIRVTRVHSIGSLIQWRTRGIILEWSCKIIKIRFSNWTLNYNNPMSDWISLVSK